MALFSLKQFFPTGVFPGFLQRPWVASTGDTGTRHSCIKLQGVLFAGSSTGGPRARFSIPNQGSLEGPILTTKILLYCAT